MGPSFYKEALVPFMEIMTDPGGRLTVPEVSAPPHLSRFYGATGENTNFSYIDGAVWARFTLRNDARVPRELYLKLSLPWIDRAELFVSTEKGYRYTAAGDSIPFTQWPVRDRNIVFRLSVPPGETICYMRFETASTLSLPLVVMSPEAYESNRWLEFPLLWGLYGALLAMVAYNLFLYMLLRDRNYLYYILFIASLVLYMATRHGTSFMYLWPGHPAWANKALPFFLLLSGLWFIQFARSFLETARTVPRVDRVLKTIVALTALGACLALFVTGTAVDRFAVYGALAALAVVTAAALLVLRKGERSAKIYFLGWVFLLVGAGVDLLRGVALLPDVELTRYALNLGATLQVIIFSFGIAERITGLQKERARAMEALSASEEKYRTLVENAIEVIFVTQDLMIKFENTNALKASGFSSEEVHSRPFLDFVHPDDRETMVERFRKRVSGEPVSNYFHFRIISKTGEVRWMEISAVSIQWEGKPAVLNFMNDITERKLAEERLRESLTEKEVLLKEIHHRVKNNMQIVSSLLSLQMDFIKNEEDRDIFVESQNRVHTMALIHEKLYQSHDLVNINFGEYLENLVNSLMHSYQVSPGAVRIVSRVDDIFLSIDVAIPCALIINEIISNSLKHAFPEGRAGEITISMEREEAEKGEGYLLSVGDNGVGLAPSVDRETPRTLGIQLIRTLVRQLRGAVEIQTEGGTRYVITFPVLR